MQRDGYQQYGRRTDPAGPPQGATLGFGGGSANTAVVDLDQQMAQGQVLNDDRARGGEDAGRPLAAALYKNLTLGHTRHHNVRDLWVFEDFVDQRLRKLGCQLPQRLTQ